MAGPKILEKTKEYALIILITLALFILGTYYFFKFYSPAYFEVNKDGFGEIWGIGLTILSSGIFLAVLKWLQFMNFFQVELHRIINSSQLDKKLQELVYEVSYSDKFLNNQNEESLILLWSRVNRALFNNQFPEALARYVEAKMQDTFMHNSKLSHYYKNFIYRLDVSLDQNDFLKIRLVTEAKIIRGDKNKFTYDFNYYSLKMDAQDKTASVEIHEILINGVAQERSKITRTDNNIQIEQKFETEMEGQTTYDLYVDLTLIYNISKDSEFTLFSERFIDDLRIEIDATSSLNTYFFPIGNESFTSIADPKGRIIKAYKELLFPEKSFRVIFLKK